MATKIVWLCSYLGMGLTLALGNRETLQSQRQDHRRVHKMSDLMNGNLLHLGIYPSYQTHRDPAPDWIVYNNQIPKNPGRPNVWEEMIGQPSKYQNVLFEELSPTILKTFYRNREAELIYEEGGGGGGGEGGGGAGAGAGGKNGNGIASPSYQRNWKRPEVRASKRVIGLPLLMYDEQGEQKPPGTTESSSEPSDVFDDLFDPASSNHEQSEDNHKDASSSTALKTDLNTELAANNARKQLQGGGIGLSPIMYEADRLPGKRIPSSGRRNMDNKVASQPTAVPPPSASIASQFMLRSARGNRQYDVPQIECPSSEDGMERFACPTPDRMGRYRCIDDHVLCDGFIDCPTGEDEDRQACMFYKTTKAHLDVLADALLRWARGR